MFFEEGLKNQFWDEGFLKFETDLSDHFYDQTKKKLESIWENKCAPKGILNYEIQQENLKRGSNRLQDLWEVVPEVCEVATNIYTLNLLQSLFEDHPRPFQTLNFPVGTQQAVHSDALHFNSKPFGKMCGVWIALENIEYNSGPLFYYPKSHLLPELSETILGFPPISENYLQVIDYWEKQIEINQYKKRVALLKKGEGIIWHGNLLHGGMPRNDFAVSRHSQVTHYYFGNARPWRQMSSLNDIQYFEPNWIPTPNL